MTYSKEQYDKDLARYQKWVEDPTVYNDVENKVKRAYLLVEIADKRLRNFESYQGKPVDVNYNVTINNPTGEQSVYALNKALQKTASLGTVEA